MMVENVPLQVLPSAFSMCISLKCVGDAGYQGFRDGQNQGWVWTLGCWGHGVWSRGPQTEASSLPAQNPVMELPGGCGLRVKGTSVGSLPSSIWYPALASPSVQPCSRFFPLPVPVGALLTVTPLLARRPSSLVNLAEVTHLGTLCGSPSPIMCENAPVQGVTWDSFDLFKERFYCACMFF